MHLIFGADPGLDGGLAFWAAPSEGHGAVVQAAAMMAMPALSGKTKRELDAVRVHDWTSTVLDLYAAELSPTEYAGNVLVVVESVHSMPKQGIVGAFTFGEGFGALKAVFRILQVPMITVLPTRWKKLVLAGTQKDKNAAVAHVKSLYPGVSLQATERSRKDHDGMADALCLMEYGKLIHGANA